MRNQVADPVVAFEDDPGLLRFLRTTGVDAEGNVGSNLVYEQEGLVNDVSFFVNRLRREREYGVSDDIELVIACGLELWWAIYFNTEKLMASTKATSITYVATFERDLFYCTEVAYKIPLAIHARLA